MSLIRSPDWRMPSISAFTRVFDALWGKPKSETAPDLRSRFQRKLQSGLQDFIEQESVLLFSCTSPLLDRKP